MSDPRRTAVVTPAADLAAIAEITAQDRAENVPFAQEFCGELTQAMLEAKPKDA